MTESTSSYFALKVVLSLAINPVGFRLVQYKVPIQSPCWKSLSVSVFSPWQDALSRFGFSCIVRLSYSLPFCPLLSFIVSFVLYPLLCFSHQHVRTIHRYGILFDSHSPWPPKSLFGKTPILILCHMCLSQSHSLCTRIFTESLIQHVVFQVGLHREQGRGE